MTTSGPPPSACTAWRPYVSIRGRFRATDRSTSAVPTFEAPYGDPIAPADGPTIHLTCTSSADQHLNTV